MTRQVRYRFGTTWWGRRWIESLESFGWGSRLTRGRNYIKDMDILSVDISPGLVKVRVVGNEGIPYNVKIGLAMFRDEIWEKILDSMASKALYTAKLLAGEMPEEIEAVFDKEGLSLFPTDINDIYASCSCPDLVSPCRHMASIYYILASRLDREPLLLFELRGIGKEELMAGLRERRTVPSSNRDLDSDAKIVEPEKEMEYDVRYIMERYWDMQYYNLVHIDIETPIINESILKRLGAPPFLQGKGDMIRQIKSSYKRVRLRALNVVSDDS